jgi:hypothetical protein
MGGVTIVSPILGLDQTEDDTLPQTHVAPAPGSFFELLQENKCMTRHWTGDQQSCRG